MHCLNSNTYSDPFTRHKYLGRLHIVSATSLLVKVSATSPIISRAMPFLDDGSQKKRTRCCEAESWNETGRNESSTSPQRRATELLSSEFPSDRPSNKEFEGCESNYSVFSTAEKRMIVLLVAMAGFFSPFSAFVYFPALKEIASSLSVSLELMNITVTMYLVVQGIVPSIFGDLSECLGRRPVYLLVFTIYISASISLACQNTYAGLLSLRMLQSAGSSGTIALAYGVISDIAAPHERGGYVGLAHIGFNTGPSLGPVIGGVLADRADWQWVFWISACLSGLVFLLLVVFLPETNRQLVGNGNKKPTGLNVSLSEQLQRSKHSRYENGPLMQRPIFRVPNPLTSLVLIFHRDAAIILATNAVFYMKYSCVQASLASLFQNIYGLSVLQSGLCYLSFGFATAIASWGVGQISNYDYRQTARHHGLSVDRRRGDEIKEFPIEKARLRTIWLYIFVSATSTIGYGWTLQRRSSIAAPLILQFLIGLAVTGIFNACNTLIVDLNSSQPAAASASVSITRCAAAAVGVSVQQVLFDAIGPGFTFTIIGCLCLSTVPLLWLERQKGWGWRLQKSQG
jgi:multidrug resistance protein